MKAKVQAHKVHKVRATLRDRKTCYNGHKMAADNVFLYMGGTWCRRCRAASRLRSRVKNAQRIVNARNAERKAAKAALQAARPAAKARKAAVVVRSPSSKLGRKAAVRKAA